MKILFIGDIFGKPGREIVRRGLPALIDRHQIDFVIANGENSAAGFGITGDIADVLFGYGIDVMTSGNHVWDKKEVLDYLPRQPKLLRPANFPASVPGRGAYLGRTRTGEPVGVVNVMGRVFMTPLDDPFAVVLKEIEALRAKTRVIIVDFHAEATSEKVAMAWHLDGRATAVLGTHTHVQTADERILPKGTACMTDVGMTGPSRLDHRRHRRSRAWPLPQRHAGAVRSGRRPWPAECGADHRRRGHGQGDAHRTVEHVAPGGRDAGGVGSCHRRACRPRAPEMSGLFDHPFEEEPPAPEAIDTPRPRRQIVTVAELTAGIRASLESGFGELWVEGEISNCRVWNTGHVYFTLKDQAAQLKAVMFRSAYRYLKFKIDDGIHVVARGRLSVYEPKGEYQLVCEHLEPQGRGALQLAFEQLKRKLQAEGLFATARKRPLPALPRKIGIVTSLDGAALKDILKVLSRRHPNAHTGPAAGARAGRRRADEDIARALKAITRVPGVDVVIVGRGGGSIEDLWAFNEEVLARAIAASPCRSFPRSDTRSTSRSRTSSRTSARRRHRLPPKWW
jgi:metallophosphoesterase (TIGR00282 family)